MGVPKFAAWLTKKYPTMVQRDCPPAVHGLYIDLNGLIHPCCHDEHDRSVAMRPEAEKLRQICLAIETLVVTARPKHVIYVAVDGVAPRAKMNQQRARRYMSTGQPLQQDGDGGVAAIDAEFTDQQRAAAEAHLSTVATQLASDALYGDDGVAPAASDSPLLPDVTDLLHDNANAKPSAPVAAYAADDAARFDSNCISPGTEFMAKVSVAVRTFLEEKLAAADPLWAGATVILSDSNTPGEGEHKLLDFIRTQSSFSGFNGHGAHVIAGLDADLIFLSLSLHIPHVFILRDSKRPSSFDRRKVKGAKACGKPGVDATGPTSSEESKSEPEADAEAPEDPSKTVIEACTTYEYYDIDVVGSSIVSEIHLLAQQSGFEMRGDPRANSGGELFAGNGYAFDRIGGKPDGDLREHLTGVTPGGDFTTFHPCTATTNSKIIDDFIVMAMIMGNDFIPRVPSGFCGESVMDNIIEVYIREVLPYGYLTLGDHDIDLRQLSRFFAAYAKIEAVKFRQFAIKSDKMTAFEAAGPIGIEADARWRSPYYDATTVTVESRKDACRAYVEGMRFVWRYYSCTSAQVSWSWFYPYHHGPFAYDLHKFLTAQGPGVQATLPPAKLETTPPEVFAQQLCILPPASKKLLPQVFRHFMTSPPEDLQDTFPKAWDVDYAAGYGKDHLSTVMLPFANMDRLKQLVRDFSSHLCEAELSRQKNYDFHLVLQLAEPTAETTAAALSKPAVSAYAFSPSGAGFSRLSPSLVPEWRLRADCPELRHGKLRETQPDTCRPRTYACTVPIFNLTTAADGKVVRLPKKAQRIAEKAGGGGGGSKKVASSGGDQDDGMTISRAVTMAMPTFAEFAVSACGVTLLAAMWLTPLCSVTAKLQVVSLFVAVVSLAYFFGFAVGAAGNRKGSGMHRNAIRMTFVDWQCGSCLSLNFSRNNRCFICEAPFDEHRDWALFSSKNAPEPPLMDPDHSKYIVRFGRVE